MIAQPSGKLVFPVRASRDGIEVLPAREFLDRLWAGNIV
jgi:hypothetical protein